MVGLVLSNRTMSLYGTSTVYGNGVGTVTTSQTNIPAGTYIAIAVGGGLGVQTTYPSLSVTNGSASLLKSIGNGYGNGARTRIYSVTMTSTGTMTASFVNNASEDRTDVQLIIFQ